ncbi:putative transcriptional regulator, ArsR family protein [Planotetraspora silvatica]|uniref:Putative transcriptional regulator, ArsR family protein n=1 Tax=Planotetraspora silvatica TaxID=234614 RepID=A0A8J3V1P3_9ACTN|nr:metalloregulator ArsR/SmtB family transcription factor [Planotetraspora silvatica]GII48345.1 putative transcriptional regulator, ArsR family protein [Planotetraspora silvatica]
MTDDDRVFKALADPTRRRLLDRLFARDGRTLSDLESDVDMTRFGVMKHLRLLEDAGLVISRKSGREKLHFLNAVPIRLIHDRWIDKYTEPQVSALVHLKTELEKTMTTTETGTTVQVHRVYIKATPEAIWTAIVDPEWTRRYGYRGVVEFDLRPGGGFRSLAGDEMPGIDPADCLVEGEVIEVDPPRRLVQTWRPTWLDEPVTQLTYEIEEGQDGVCSVTITHDVRDAPQTAAQVAGQVQNAGGGWTEVLSDLKSLLETGSSLYR